MNFAIRKLRLAEEDALDAAIWYEKRQAGLGEDFLDEVDRAVQRLSGEALHGRVRFADVLIPVWPEAEMCRTDLSSLAPFAVDLRYPGGKVDLQTANKAWHTCGRIRSFARTQLDLES